MCSRLWRQPGPAPAVAGIQRVNLQMEDFLFSLIPFPSPLSSPSLHPSLPASLSLSPLPPSSSLSAFKIN